MRTIHHARAEGSARAERRKCELEEEKTLSGRSIAVGVSSERERIGNAHTRKSTRCELPALQVFALYRCHHILKVSNSTMPKSLRSALSSYDMPSIICRTQNCNKRRRAPKTKKTVSCFSHRAAYGHAGVKHNTSSYWTQWHIFVSSDLGWCNLQSQ